MPTGATMRSRAALECRKTEEAPCVQSTQFETSLKLALRSRRDRATRPSAAAYRAARTARTARVVAGVPEATANVRFEQSPQTLGPASFSRTALNRWQSSSMSRAQHALVNARRTSRPDQFRRARRNLIRNCARALRPVLRRVVAASSPRHIAKRRPRTRRSLRRGLHVCSSSLSGVT